MEFASQDDDSNFHIQFIAAAANLPMPWMQHLRLDNDDFLIPKLIHAAAGAWKRGPNFVAGNQAIEKASDSLAGQNGRSLLCCFWAMAMPWQRAAQHIQKLCGVFCITMTTAAAAETSLGPIREPMDAAVIHSLISPRSGRSPSPEGVSPSDSLVVWRS